MEGLIVSLCVSCSNCCSKACKKKNLEEVNEDEVFSQEENEKEYDLINLLNFGELYELYEKTKLERQKIKLLVSKGKLRKEEV
jgi:hypothetical protein